VTGGIPDPVYVVDVDSDECWFAIFSCGIPSCCWFCGVVHVGGAFTLVVVVTLPFDVVVMTFCLTIIRLFCVVLPFNVFLNFRCYGDSPIVFRCSCLFPLPRCSGCRPSVCCPIRPVSDLPLILPVLLLRCGDLILRFTVVLVWYSPRFLARLLFVGDMVSYRYCRWISRSSPVMIWVITTYRYLPVYRAVLLRAVPLPLIWPPLRVVLFVGRVRLVFGARSSPVRVDVGRWWRWTPRSHSPFPLPPRYTLTCGDYRCRSGIHSCSRCRWSRWFRYCGPLRGVLQFLNGFRHRGDPTMPVVRSSTLFTPARSVVVIYCWWYRWWPIPPIIRLLLTSINSDGCICYLLRCVPLRWRYIPAVVPCRDCCWFDCSGPLRLSFCRCWWCWLMIVVIVMPSTFDADAFDPVTHSVSLHWCPFDDDLLCWYRWTVLDDVGNRDCWYFYLFIYHYWCYDGIVEVMTTDCILYCSISHSIPLLLFMIWYSI